MSGHSIGPWELDGIAIAGSDPRGGDICLMGEPAQYPGDTARMLDNWEANARLIAAAPDLLQALVEMVGLDELTRQTMDWPDTAAAIAARAAIAKATGK